MNSILVNIDRCNAIKFIEPYESTKYFIKSEYTKISINRWFPWKKKQEVIPESIGRYSSNYELLNLKDLEDHEIYYREGNKIMVRSSIKFYFNDDNYYEKYFRNRDTALDEFNRCKSYIRTFNEFRL